MAVIGLAPVIAGCGSTSKTPPPPSVSAAAPGIARVGGLSGTDVTAAADLAVYPSGGAHRTGGWVIFNRDSWTDALEAAQFAAAPTNAALLPVAPNFLPAAPKDLLNRVTPDGFPLSSGIQAMLLGGQATDLLALISDRKLKAAQIKAATPAELAAQLVPYRGGFAHAYSGNVVIVSDQAREYALPAGAWSAYSGDTVAFVERDSVPRATAGLLAQRVKLLADKPSIYVIGPPSVIGRGVVAKLRRYGTVKRIAGADAVGTAVALARYRDPATGFGWGLLQGPASVSLMNSAAWGDAPGAYMFAGAGPQAPLLLTDSALGIPASVDAYLKQLRSIGLGGPSQGFAFGDERRIAQPAIAQMSADLRG